ncbi:metal-dependent hydrolase [Halobacillus sp. H74]|uniref:metal-dependent hydrolase n=1 Tax=Halobacillus sp. H74 TaxID=3457436 RepID=UPI003FCD6EEB
MEGKTHIVGGLAAGVGYSVLVGTGDTTPFLVGCMVGSLIPDIDHPQGKLGRVLPFLSKPISSIFGHRTVTHSLLFLVIVGVAFQFLNLSQALEIGIMIGLVSHIVLDSVTKDGVKLFYPFDFNFRIPPGISTGGFIEKGVLIGLCFLVAYYGYGMFL